MAIFVALIFQILFLFFAMAINIGLVVHDKINLQNAVDLSAYYAAQRQAEMLNVIAHTNYQIRQSWKLLNWRYYVLGSMGVETPMHPAMGGVNSSNDDEPWPALAAPNSAPSVCITYQPTWKTSGLGDNACKSETFNVTNIQIPPLIAGFSPTNLVFDALARRVQRQIADTCTSYAGQNWLFSSMAYVSYMLDQRNRKELIRALARNMALPAKEMVDLNGDLVFEGAHKTFLKNLTATNESSQPEFEMFNSLVGLQPADWLTETDIFFTLGYSDMTGDSQGCQTVQKQIQDRPGPQTWAELVKFVGNEQSLVELHQYVLASRSIAAGDSMRVSLGVEKNPWYLAYVGVKARSKPRQLFPPFGEPVEFEAQAFAQPFGGRIGPWYGSFWARGARGSEGDRLQLSPEKLLANGIMNSNNPDKLVPQYSKYPGDRLGLRSVLAQSALVGQGQLIASINDYGNIYEGFGRSGVNDVVAFSDDPQSKLRQYEISALAPDLFDITYYSIQPNFGTRYLPLLRRNMDKIKIPAVAYPRGDLGSRSIEGGEEFSVQDQIAVANGRPVKFGVRSNIPPQQFQKPQAFWYVREQEHLLTDWVHNDTYGQYFAFPEGRFGKCQETDARYQMTGVGPAPGSCLHVGGRAGYSVKIISPDILREPLKLGGPGQSAGTILNPPPEGW